MTLPASPEPSGRAPTRAEVRGRAERGCAAVRAAKAAGQNEHQVALDFDDQNAAYVATLDPAFQASYLEMYDEELRACEDKEVEAATAEAQRQFNERLQWMGALVGLLIGLPILMQMCS